MKTEILSKDENKEKQIKSLIFTELTHCIPVKDLIKMLWEYLLGFDEWTINMYTPTGWSMNNVLTNQMSHHNSTLIYFPKLFQFHFGENDKIPNFNFTNNQFLCYFRWFTITICLPFKEIKFKSIIYFMKHKLILEDFKYDIIYILDEKSYLNDLYISKSVVQFPFD